MEIFVIFAGKKQTQNKPNLSPRETNPIRGTAILAVFSWAGQVWEMVKLILRDSLWIMQQIFHILKTSLSTSLEINDKYKRDIFRPLEFTPVR